LILVTKLFQLIQAKLPHNDMQPLPAEAIKDISQYHLLIANI